MAALSVEQIDPHATLFLRRLVLHPERSYEQLAADVAVPSAFAIGALVERVVASCGLALPEPFPAQPFPLRPDRARSWRLRGMATHPDRRGQGLGTLVLDRLLDELRLHDATLVWCWARADARSLYLRAGFAETGEEYDDSAVGRSLLLWRDL